MFALMAPVVVGSAGMAIDFAGAYLVQQRLAQAIDSAALAGAASSSDAAEIENRIRKFFEANYPPEKLGATFDPEVEIVGDEIRVGGRARYHTSFLTLIGINEIDVNAYTVVQREVQGLEVALVLDNTGSMATNDNIGTLKSATKSFINILFERTSNPDYVRIGMVPYSNSVRIGRYGLGYTPDGQVYGDGDVFVILPPGVSYTTNHDSSSGWYGCVVEHMESGYQSSATPVNNAYGQLWRYSSNWKGHGWNPGSSSNDPYDFDVLDQHDGPWDIYMYGKVVSNGEYCNGSGYSSSRCSDCTGNNNRCNSSYCYCRNSTPNRGCPYAYIIPLSSDQETLLDRVDDMVPEGNTLGNVGMLWGSRLISPEPPFTEGSSWGNEFWKKAIIMMTDGDNTSDGTYSNYWFANKHNMNVTKFNTRFGETCEDLKEKGVLIYTITFASGTSDNTKAYYRDCASSESQYYDAPTQEKLLEVFDAIARELSNLHIKQ
ncbi:MAG: pilus assembly protein [Alphaproteobacteria bacterium]|nr:pilus assembly protein [Alphaproteobacteria bacterium]